MSSKVRKEHVILSSYDAYYSINSLFNAFSEYQSIMDKNSTNQNPDKWNNACLKFDEKFDTVNIIKDQDTLCPQALKYLYNICNDSISNPLEVNHFKYLYYWIYKNHLEVAKDRNYIKELYHEILNVYNNAGLYITYVVPFKDVIFDDELEIITDICDMSNKLNEIKYSTFTYCKNKSRCDCADECAAIYMHRHEACETNWDEHFCNILERNKNVYNELNLSQYCGKLNCKTLPCEKFENIILPSAQIYKSKTAIISSYLIYIIPALLFIIYKFLPYNSYLHREIKKLKNMCLGLKKELSKLENSEIYNNIRWNSNYNVLYSSH
ncbi:variable surface protein [Plasmodium gonderi]|uniref:Variable surface protein n=1 Tax=Plasmodium gonderi TaxID=77519 RepID=A0A1Y1JUA2_PLAGO|nr:variable surface protein [Plasmodium gonderi]GAW83983.1 variable surface protein [Plasmodium gonderi]